jgi:DUF3108-like
MRDFMRLKFVSVFTAAHCFIWLPALAETSAAPAVKEASPPAADAATAAPSKAVIDMAAPAPGDHWTYELHDQITGEVKRTFTQIVTDTTATDVSVRVEVVGKSETNFVNYDRSWNVVKNGVWSFSPNDGTGVRLPLSAGQTWTFQSDILNSSNGVARKRTGRSKVIGAESLTTKAGTFDTFKIETSYSVRNVNNPLQAQFTEVTWYAPAIDHWVKRTYEMRTDGQLRENNFVELTDYGRKKGDGGTAAAKP